MREKGGRRRFRPGWMQNDPEAGVDNPAMTLDPIASFTVGDPEDADPSVTINVTDYDKEETSLV